MKKLKLLATALCALMAITAFAACKAPDKQIDKDALHIAILKKGYGSEFAHSLAEAYQQKTGMKVQFVYDESSEASMTLLIQSKNSGIDIAFDIAATLNSVMARKNYIKGYDKAFVDLEDVYNAPALGYEELTAKPGLINRDIINEYMLDMIANDQDGKMYAMPWVMDINGFVYNKTIWERDKAKLGSPELPKTTDEMFTLFDHIKSVSGANKKPYAFKYAGQSNQMWMAFGPWLAQYDGKEAMSYFYKGQDINGGYTPDIYMTDGREAALAASRKLLLKTNGYVDTADAAGAILNVQGEFLQGNAYFHTNGSWLERETAENYDPADVEISFLKTPVISAIVDKWPAVFTGSAAAKDAMLRQAIDYIDGDTSAKPAFLNGHDDILVHLTDARNTVYTIGSLHYAAVPAYSTHIEEAKDFLKFMLSKEGQEIMLAASYGNMMPLNVNPQQFEYYNTAYCTTLSKSKMDIFKNAVLTGYPFKYPMSYFGGLDIIRSSHTIEIAFGGDSPEAVGTFMTKDYNYYNDNWADRMSLAGV